VSLMRTCGKPVLVVLAVLVALSEAAAQEPASLENGYRLMYGLDFRSAETVFQEWQREHPRDPFGPMSAASNLLFEELNRMGILEAQFFVDDSSFTARRALAPDLQLRGRFEAALADAESLDSGPDTSRACARLCGCPSCGRGRTVCRRQPDRAVRAR